MTIKQRLVYSLSFILVVFLVVLCGTLFFFPSTGGSTLRWTLAACSTIGVLAVLGILYNVLVNLCAPLESIRDFTAQVEKGNTKATLRGNFIKELELLKNSISSMVTHLQDVSKDAQDSHAEITRRSNEMEQTLASSRKQAKETQTLLRQMSQGASKAQGASSQIFNAIRELSSMTEQVSDGVQLQRDRMTETATAMEEMTGTVIEIARNATAASDSAGHSKQNAETGAGGVREAVSSIQNVEHRILGLKDSMSQLGSQAENIGQIITVINDIADQTNLLALNAAIEAARAGDAGRGFAVVADEVRKLAEKTMHATKEVGDAVTQIQSHAHKNVVAVDAAADDIVKSTEVASQSGQFMAEIVDIVDNTALQVDSIATASEEQSQASEEINRAVSDVTRVAQDTATDMEQASDALIQISSLVEDLDSIIQAMASGKLSSAVGDNLVEWSDDLSVNVREIDDQHKVLIDLINELNAAMRQKKSQTMMLDVVDRLAQYAVTHFQTEEDIFDRINYPLTNEHKQIHEKFVQKVVEFESELKSGTAKVTMDVMRFLKDWLIQHIQGTDKKYTKHMNDAGIY